MDSNFSSLPLQWELLTKTAVDAEQQVFSVPLCAAMLCRISLEEWIRWMYEHDIDLELPYDNSLNVLMYQRSFKELIGPSFFSQFHTIRKLGNDTGHTEKNICATETLHSVKLLHGFIFHAANLYSIEQITIPSFNESIIPKRASAEKSKQELRNIEESFLQSLEPLKKSEKDLEAFKKIKSQ